MYVCMYLCMYVYMYMYEIHEVDHHFFAYVLREKGNKLKGMLFSVH